MQRTFIFYQDPSHGWVKVEIALLWAMGIQKQISKCSYQRGEFAYLEEDADLDVFFKAFKKQYGIEPILREKIADKQSKIRSYESYNQY